MNKKQVFISYKSDERDQALWTRTVLEENGISCWMDTDVPPGANYAHEINRALKNAVAMVLIMSKKSQMSEHVKNEINLASKYSKFITAFVIEECDMVAGFDFNLPEEQRHNAFINRAEAIDSMVLSLKNVIALYEEDSYKVIDFLKERHKYLKEKKQREAVLRQATKKVKPPRTVTDKKVIKRFPMCLTPYAMEYFTAPNARLALNIHTFFVALMSLAFFLLIGAVVIDSGTMRLISFLAPFIIFAFFFFVGEAISGCLSYFIGKIKTRLLVVVVSLATGYFTTYVSLGLFMLLLRIL